ncbi:MAG: type II secretion system protein GspD, partial [Tardiphaga sp.]
VRFVPNARLRSIIVISSRPEYLRKAEAWIRRIDMAGQETEKRAFVYHVQYRPVAELVQVLQKVYSPREQQRLAAEQAAASGAGTTTTAVTRRGIEGSSRWSSKAGRTAVPKIYRTEPS